MSYTKEEIYIARKMYYGWAGMDTPLDFGDWVLQLKTDEPKPQYRCISNAWPFEHAIVGEESSDRLVPTEGVDLSQFPNHWEEIKAPEPYTMADAVKDLEAALWGQINMYCLSEVLGKMKASL